MRRDSRDKAVAPGQAKISAFFVQRKQQFVQTKSLSDRNVVVAAHSSSSSSSSSLIENKKRKAEEDVTIIREKEEVVEERGISSHDEKSTSPSSAPPDASSESSLVQASTEVVSKKRRVLVEETIEKDEDADTEEDEEIKADYEREKRNSRLAKKRRSEEESSPAEKSPSTKRASPPNGRRLLHANTVTDLKELKRRSPTAAKNFVASLQARSPDQARRSEETEAKRNEERQREPEVDRSRTRLRREAQTEQGHTIQVRHGDITAEIVGAVVNAANSHLAHGGGVAGAIMRAGGREVQVESDRWIRQHGEVATGEVAVTGPGRMGCEYIIHAVGPICFNRENMPKKDRELASAVHNSLLKAEELGLRSISLPAISSGIFGYPKERCAEVMFTTALSFCRTHPNSTLRVIRFTNWDMETVTIFEEEFEKRFGTRDQQN